VFNLPLSSSSRASTTWPTSAGLLTGLWIGCCPDPRADAVVAVAPSGADARTTVPVFGQRQPGGPAGCCGAQAAFVALWSLRRPGASRCSRCSTGLAVVSPTAPPAALEADTGRARRATRRGPTLSSPPGRGGRPPGGGGPRGRDRRRRPLARPERDRAPGAADGDTAPAALRGLVGDRRADGARRGAGCRAHIRWNRVRVTATPRPDRVHARAGGPPAGELRALADAGCAMVVARAGRGLDRHRPAERRLFRRPPAPPRARPGPARDARGDRGSAGTPVPTILGAPYAS
jgi:hypothetical protein